MVGATFLVTVKKKPATVSTRRSTRPRGMATQGKILAAAVTTITERGLDGASTHEVARRAGVKQSLVMYHFPSKKELCWAAASATIEDFTKSFLENISASRDMDPAENLRRIFHAYIEFAAGNPEFHRFMIEVNRHRSEEFNRMIEEHMRPAYEYLREEIRRAQSAGAVIQGDTDIVYYAMIGTAATLFSLPVEFECLTGKAASEKDVVEGVKAVFDGLFFSSPTSNKRSSPIGEAKGGHR
jgi:AcrR family transcriptional regulator